ncbi:MAG: carboxypeptidase regulatory-like domain-containing protein, partial [Acidobacteriaceae bacterium]|nr:carboxypeptidase regulatory-like domain-containing protein [Acidobacteriaceae bacterium]
MKYSYHAVILLCCAVCVIGQTNRGSITGTVTDNTGAVVPNVQVTATETNTRTTYRTVTSGTGDYSFPQAQVGTYDLTFSAQNLRTETRSGVIVQINTPSVVNIALSVGTETQTITVSAGGPTVESTTSEIGGVVTSQQVEELPLSLGGVGAFRSPEAFTFLLPGTFGPGTGNSSNGIYIQKTSGGQNFGDEIILDGGFATRPDNGSTFDETSPSVEALQEFRVTTATPPAQFGRTTGGIRSFTTHAGTNTVHGTAFDIFRSTDLDANTWFNNLQRGTCTGAACQNFGTPKDIRNDYGLSLGGPVVIPRLYNGRDRTFFFFTWEQLQWPRSAATTSTLPTAAERGGNFAALLTNNQIGTNPCTGAAVYAGQIFDPNSTTTAPNGGL